MTGEPEAKDASTASTDEEPGPWVHDPHVLAWATEHLPELRRSVSERRTLRWSLAVGFLVGLVAHVSGYLLKMSVTTEPLALLADLLYTLGWALWTGVVVTVFFQIAPEAKTRQIKRAGDALEAALREKAAAGSGLAATKAAGGD
jgi:ABC-type nickel/cobalt efflux system permease component RcnA